MPASPRGSRAERLPGAGKGVRDLARGSQWPNCIHNYPALINLLENMIFHEQSPEQGDVTISQLQ